MAKIVLIHGAFNELWGPNELKSRWLPAVRDGLWHHETEVADDDVAVCFYGDLFRLTPGSDADRAVAASRESVTEALRAMAGPEIMAVLGQAANDAAFDRTVDLMAVMASQPDLRQRIADRLHAAIGPETKVVVAHSLGTIVAYLYLSNHPEVEVDLVTLGCPLANPALLGHLAASHEGKHGEWPGSVRRWVDVAALGDKATAGGSMAECFGPALECRRVDNGQRAHDPEPYLNAAATGEAIARALRD